MVEAVFRASSTQRFLSCNMSVIMKLLYPDGNEPHEVTNEGTEFHDVMYWYYKHNEIKPNYEYVNFVKECATYVDELRGDAQGVKFHLEQDLDLSFLFISGSGICDLFFVRHGVLHVVDYKFGYTKVSSVKNAQLMVYALAIMHHYKGYDIRRVMLHILQPRINNYCSSRVSRTELKAFQKKVGKAVFNALQGNIKATPSVDACRYCTGLLKCTEAYKKAKEVSGLKNYELYQDFDYLKMYVARFERETTNDLKKGVNLGYKHNLCLVPVVKRKAWEPSSVKKLVALIGDKAYVNGRLITPTEARKLLPDTVINTLIKKDNITEFKLGSYKNEF